MHDHAQGNEHVSTDLKTRFQLNTGPVLHDKIYWANACTSHSVCEMVAQPAGKAWARYSEKVVRAERYDIGIQPADRRSFLPGVSFIVIGMTDWNEEVRKRAGGGNWGVWITTASVPTP